MSTGSGLTAAQEKKLREGGIQQVKDAARADVEAAEKPKKVKAEKAAEPKTTTAKRDPRECECGCGEMTKGGRFRPGHDAKLHSRQKAEEKAKAEAAPVPGQQTIEGGEVATDGGEI